MRFFRRRFKLRAPRLSVRRVMPWPLRWLLAAVVLGLCGALSLWSFEFGKEIAGLEKNTREELASLRTEVAELREVRQKIQSEVNAANLLLTTERAMQESLANQIKQLEADNLGLREDLGFFEKLIPAPQGQTLGIRGVQAELLSASQLRWQVLVIQSIKNAPLFKGQLKLTLTGVQNAKPWSMTLPDSFNLELRQYRRMNGLVNLPEGVQVQTIAVKVLEGSTVRANQTIKVDKVH